MTNDSTHGLPSPADVVFFDLEADGLNPTRIHCTVAKHNGTVEVLESQAEVQDYVTRHSGKYFVAHNGTGYDLPVLDKLYSVVLESTIDTLVLSRLADPSRDGGHSLAAWGKRCGNLKGDYTGPWDTYNPAMRDYCIQDVEVLEQTYTMLLKELEGFSAQSIKLEHDAAFCVQQQIENGWLLNEEHCFLLLAELKEKKYELEDAVREAFRPMPKAIREVTPKLKKDGSISRVGIKHLGDYCLSVSTGGMFTAVEWQEFNLGSRQQIGERLIRCGWKPEKFTPTGQPIVSEEVLIKVQGIPEAQLIAEYLTVQKRIAQIQSWLECVDTNGRVHGYVNTNGAVTGRMTHSEPNMAQVPAVYSLYGPECREAWTVKDGYKLVGADAGQLELRLLAHYMNDAAYTHEVTEGDVHTANQRAASLATRDQAKTFIYAFLYGAGDEKIGKIAGRDRQAGRNLKERFLRNTPALKQLRERVGRASQRGYLKGLDGRRVYVRSEHAALNTLLQGAGAVVMKQALVLLHEYVEAAGLDAKPVGNVHDEFQWEVLAAHAEQFAELARKSIVDAGEQLKLRCPMTADAKIGTTWKDTH